MGSSMGAFVQSFACGVVAERFHAIDCLPQRRQLARAWTSPSPPSGCRQNPLCDILTVHTPSHPRTAVNPARSSLTPSSSSFVTQFAQIRAAVLTASQCATYDEVKLFFLRNLGWEDTVGTHLAGASKTRWREARAPPSTERIEALSSPRRHSFFLPLAVSTVAGLVTATVISPVDMVKTNIFVNPKYSSPLACAVDILHKQGVRGMFRGCVSVRSRLPTHLCCASIRDAAVPSTRRRAHTDPSMLTASLPSFLRRWGANWARQGPMTTVIFVTLEALRHEFGLGAF